MLGCLLQAQVTLPSIKWPPGDPSRPRPVAVAPGGCCTQEYVGRAPSDAIVLFDGRDLSQWFGPRNGEPKWKVADGYMEVTEGSGSLQSKRPFGSCQLHVEFATPAPPAGDGQERANSGIKFMSRYEIQILDSYDNPTYADGYAGAVYQQYPPLVNPSLPPGSWQTYDIVFHAPKFASDGTLVRPATATVLYNGVLVQDNAVIVGPTSTETGIRDVYRKHSDKVSLQLQNHHAPLRFRNIWIRELPDGDPYAGR
jgi:hypothetical protein